MHAGRNPSVAEVNAVPPSAGVKSVSLFVNDLSEFST
jgi:hypothetical protein